MCVCLGGGGKDRGSGSPLRWLQRLWEGGRGWGAEPPTPEDLEVSFTVYL